MRFPEFSGEWEKCKIGDIAPLQRGFDLPTHQIKDGAFPVVYSNGIMNYHSSYKCIAPGLVTGRSGTIGKFTFISNGYYWPHNTSLWVTNFNGNIPEFVYYLYQTINIKQYVTGSGVPTLNRNDVHLHKVYIPQIKEQSKIARLLMLLDERITTQNKIIEDLKILKSALYHLIFRTIDNEFTSLGKIASIVKGTQINGTELLDEGDYYVMNGGIQPSGYYDKYNVPTNTISISEGGNSCGYVQYNTSPFWSGGHCYTIQRIDSSIITEFLYHYLKYKEPEIMKLRIGSGLPNIQKKDLECFPIVNIPLQEQKGIVELFNMFETKEINESKILSLLQKQKSYLLGEMFI